MLMLLYHEARCDWERSIECKLQLERFHKKPISHLDEECSSYTSQPFYFGTSLFPTTTTSGFQLTSDKHDVNSELSDPNGEEGSYGSYSFEGEGPLVDLSFLSQPATSTPSSSSSCTSSSLYVKSNSSTNSSLFSL
jgi:hypothetical protein